MTTRLIFVCHGQLPEERQNGLQMVELINRTTGFRAFFAEAVHDTDGLSQHIFANLERCDGFLAVMHKRGEVVFRDRHFIRSSVWIQQELAIVTFLNHQRQHTRRIRVRVFAERGIKREGLAEVLILNPVEFERDDALPGLVTSWLLGPDFQEDPIGSTREELFKRIAAQLHDIHWHFLEILLILSCGTTSAVYETHVAQMLALLGGSLPSIGETIGYLAGQGLVDAKEVPRMGGVRGVSLSPAFIDLIAEEVRRRGGLARKFGGIR